MKTRLCGLLAISTSLCYAGLLVAQDFRITSIEQNGVESPSITWNSVAGKTYRVEYHDGFGAGGWTRDLFPIRAGGGALTWRESTALVPSQRFYQIAEPDGLQFTNPGPGGGSFIMSIAVHPNNSNVVYLGGDIEGPFRTSDGGASYRRVTGNLAGGEIGAGVYAGQALHFDPGNAGRLYMTSWNGLYRTDDEGRTWDRLDLEADTSIAGIAVSPGDSNLILVGTGDVEGNVDGTSSIYRSTDGGATFVNVTETGVFGQSATTVHVILFDPLDPAIVYAATGEGVLKSVDSGQTWNVVNNGLPASPVAHGLVGAIHDGGFRLFATLMNQTTTPAAMESAGFVGGGVYRSLDGGANWQDITGDLPRTQFDDELMPPMFLPYSYWHIVVDPVDPNKLYVGTENVGDENAYESLGVYRTANALDATPGNVDWTWSMPDNSFTDIGWLDNTWWLDLHVGFLGMDPANPGTLYAGSDHLFKTVDGGLNWTEVYSDTVDLDAHQFRGRGIEAMEPFGIAVDPNDANRWWVGYDDMGLFRTDDGGETWFRIDDKQRSENLGDTDCPVSVVTDPTDSSVVYQGRNNGENDQGDNWNVGVIFKTTDNGQTWSQIGSGQLGPGRPYLLMTPGGTVGSRTLFAAIYGQGLFQSSDSGATWTSSDTGFAAYDKAHIWVLARHPTDSQTLYAGIADAGFEANPADGGIYRSSDGGATWARLGGTAPTGQVADLAVGSDGVVYAAASDVFSTLRAGTGTRQGGIYRSTDDGANWTRSLATSRADQVDVSAFDGRYVIAGVSTKFDTAPGHNAGVYISRDSGATWQRESDGLTHTRFWFARFHPADSDRIFVGTGGGGLFVGSGAMN